MDKDYDTKCKICKKPYGKERIFFTMECTHKFHEECFIMRCMKYKTRMCPICKKDINRSCIKMTEQDIRNEGSYEYLLEILNEKKHDSLEDQFMSGIPISLRNVEYGHNCYVNKKVKVGISDILFLKSMIVLDNYEETELFEIFKLIFSKGYTYNLYEMYEDSLELGNDEPSLIISLLNKYDDYEDKEIFMYIFNGLMENLMKSKGTPGICEDIIQKYGDFQETAFGDDNENIRSNFDKLKSKCGIQDERLLSTPSDDSDRQESICKKCKKCSKIRLGLKKINKKDLKKRQNKLRNQTKKRNKRDHTNKKIQSNKRNQTKKINTKKRLNQIYK